MEDDTDAAFARFVREVDRQKRYALLVAWFSPVAVFALFMWARGYGHPWLTIGQVVAAFIGYSILWLWTFCWIFWVDEARRMYHRILNIFPPRRRP